MDIREIFSRMTGNSDLNRLLQASGVVINNTNINDSGTPDLIECPGINYVTNPNIGWVVPYGETPERVTYCPSCARELDIGGETYYSSGHYMCNSYIKKNKLDNGVINISFWSTDLKTMYPCSDGKISLPSGTEFCIFIDARLKSGQYYRYECDIGNLRISNTNHHIRTTLVMHNGNNKFLYLSSDEPQLAEFRKYNGTIPHIISDSDIRFLFYFTIFTVTKQDCLLETDKDYGRFAIGTSGKLEARNKKPVGSLIQSSYNLAPREAAPYIHFTRFSKKPLIMSVDIDYSAAGASLQRYKDVIIKKQRDELKEIKTLLSETKEQLSTLQDKVTDLCALETKLQQDISQLQ